MFDVYAFATPNSIKVPIALEELGLDDAAVESRPAVGRATERVTALVPQA